MQDLKAAFDRSVGRDGAPIHFAAHSHHPWPDVSYDAHQRCWLDSAELLDRKWEKVFGEVVPEAQRHIAGILTLSDPASVCFAPNTHEFVLRLLSCLDAGRVPRILTTDSEFHSFTRQVARLEEEGLVEIVRVPAEPLPTFDERFAAHAARGGFDLIFFSAVFFNSGFSAAAAEIVAAVKADDALIAIDGYHAFMALPQTLGPELEKRVFYIAGGYKYAMAGEGVCFMHCPPGYGARPRDTGWYAEFGTLGGARGGVTAYAPDGSRFAGATFDPSGLYRFNAVQRWLTALGADGTVTAQTAYAIGVLQPLLLARLPSAWSRSLIVPDANRRGRFLTFSMADAARIEAELLARNIMVDRRGDRLRIGFGIYQDEADVDLLAAALTDIGCS